MQNKKDSRISLTLSRYLIVKIKSVGLRSFLGKTLRERSRQSNIRIRLIFFKVGTKIENSLRDQSTFTPNATKKESTNENGKKPKDR
jgi:hypothetical protein